MNVCLTSKEYPLETGWGGLATRTFNLANQLKVMGHNVDVISMSNETEKRYEENGVSIERIYYKKQLKGRFINSLFYSKKVNEHVKKTIYDKNIDVVQSPDLDAEGYHYSKRKKKPFIVHLHGPVFHLSPILYDNYFVRKDCNLVGRLEKDMIKRADVVTSDSFALSKIVINECRLEKDVPIIPPGINIKKYDLVTDDVSFRKKHKIQDDDLLILYLGRFDKLKGLEILTTTIPNIVNNYQNIHFVLAGDHSKTKYKERILDKINASNKNRVYFSGYVSGLHKISLIKNSDLMIVPSLWDNFPNVCLEAMTCNKPVIASKVGGIPELIKDKSNGILFDPYLENDLYLKLSNLIMKRDKINDLGIRARKTVENEYSVEIMAKKTLKVYESILNK